MVSKKDTSLPFTGTANRPDAGPWTHPVADNMVMVPLRMSGVQRTIYGQQLAGKLADNYHPTFSYNFTTYNQTY